MSAFRLPPKWQPNQGKHGKPQGLRRWLALAIIAAVPYHLPMTAKPAPARDRDQADDDGYLAGVDEGLADIKAGRFVPYEKVRRWLLSWGSDNELPPPKVP